MIGEVVLFLYSQLSTPMSITFPDHDLQSIVVLVFFPTYVIFQPPATVLTRKLGPRKFLASICLLWGAIEIVSTAGDGSNPNKELTCVWSFGFVRKWTDLLALRVLLGILESGLYPSIVYLLATWYSRCRFACCFYVLMILTRLLRRCRETIFGFLRHWLSRVCIRRYSGLWADANGWARR